MHRSGTSLVAKCFEVFGYGLGETLMAASDDNPKGFFEDLDVVAFNDALLESNGSSWDAPVFMGQRPLAWDRRQVEAGAELLKAKLEREPQLAIKDPRLCLTLPYWHAAAQFLKIPLRVCLVYRNPLRNCRITGTTQWAAALRWPWSHSGLLVAVTQRHRI